MPNDNADHDIRQSLARAFDRAWAAYYRPGRQTLSEDIARTELARRLVQLSKAGVYVGFLRDLARVITDFQLTEVVAQVRSRHG